MTYAQLAQRCLISMLKIAPADNDELNALKAAGNPFPLDLGYEHGFDEILRGEEVPPRPEPQKDESISATEDVQEPDVDGSYSFHTGVAL